MTKFEEYNVRKAKEYGNKFDCGNINLDFVKYYNSGERITVDFGYEKKRGTIGITTGWKPCFLLILTKRSLGSSYTIGQKDKVIIS